MTIPTVCPRCDSDNTVELPSVEVQTCLDCGLSWWWDEDEDALVVWPWPDHPQRLLR